MSDIWIFGSMDLGSSGGAESPDPPIAGDSWTWDVSLATDSSQTTLAKTSLNTVYDLTGGYVFSGIVQYSTLNPDGSTTLHPVGETDPSGWFNSGVTDSVWDTAVVDITFGWGIGSASGFEVSNVFTANVDLEVWVTG